MTNRLHTPILDRVLTPSDLDKIDDQLLQPLADEVRAEMIDAVSVTGGHLGAGLGVVELTVALHKVFSSPNDRLIFDVGHQSYPHKILTGRRKRIRSLRQEGGLSGFTKRSESEHDPFGTGHSSTSISAGLGMAIGSALQNRSRNVITLIGDGALSAGMAYEALNNAGALGGRLIVILNDNSMSIAKPTGAMSSYLARLSPEDKPQDTIFSDLGFEYVGPIDGHDLAQLLPTLRNAREKSGGPTLIHVRTQKGKGYAPAEAAEDKYHGVGKFDIITGALAKSKPNAPTYTSVFANSLIQEADRDEKIVAVTAAMPSGTGLDIFAEHFPSRCFDVGIAEQHAVTFAAGMAAEGLKPFAALYSTFLQRAYDQVVHDVAIQNLPVRFPIDRAGFVGADGATHAGSFDTTFLATIPNMVVMAASDEAELMHMTRTAAAYDDGPISFRYPRGEGIGVELPERGDLLEIGKGRIIKEGTKIALLSFGTRLADCQLAAEELDAAGLSTTVADARFAKPLDFDLIKRLADAHEVLITIEEGSVGGFGSHVAHFLTHEGLLDHGLKFRPLFMPDVFLDQAKPADLYKKARLDRAGVVDCVFKALGSEQSAMPVPGK